MVANTKIVTSTYNVEAMKVFQRELSETPHYVFTGKNVQYTPNDSNIPVPNTNQTEAEITIYNNMIFGKKITEQDFLPVIKNYAWTSGTVYSQYDPRDENLEEKNFYTVVQKGSIYNVYKCLYNNSGSESTVEPDGTNLTSFTSPVDGYIWKYIYTFTSSDYSKFSILTDYVPVIANTSITQNAIPGTIEAIDITNSGAGYTNYFQGAFRAQDIRISGNDTQYSLLETASDSLELYTGCTIQITSGSGVGQYKKITSYTTSNSLKLIQIDSPFSITPNPGDTYQINPSVIVVGDGNEVSICDSIAVVNPLGNTISEIQILDFGSGYRNCTAYVSASNSVNVTTQAELNPLVAPTCGHGGDITKELYADSLCISVTFNKDESGFIPIQNDYRTIGIIRDPLFNNVSLTTNQIDQRGSFLVNEKLYQIKSQKLSGNVTVTSNSSLLTGTNTSFFESLSNNDYVWITDNIHDTFQQVSSITSNTALILSTNTVTWSNTGCSIYKASILNEGVVSSVNGSVIIVNNLHGDLDTLHNRFIGGTSSATTTLNQNTSIQINTKLVNDFLTYNQLTRLEGSFLTNTSFTQDELLVAGNSSAIFHSTVNNSVYVLEPTNYNDLTGIITGQSSSAQFQISNKYRGNLKLDSGKIVYVENVSPITRKDNSSETIKILFTF